LCEALVRWAEGDDAGADGAFIEARGLWPDPLILFWLARWQSHKEEYDAALTTLGELRAASGTLLRYHFAGLSVLGAIEEARCLFKLSRFPESLRLYRRTLGFWQANAGAFGIVHQVQREYLAVQQGAKTHDRLLGNSGARRDR
jgi:hypothetical protein